MKTVILALFGLLALVNAAPQNYFVDPTNSHAGHPYAYADPTIIVGKAQFNPQAYPYNYEPARYVQLFSWTIAAS